MRSISRALRALCLVAVLLVPLVLVSPAAATPRSLPMRMAITDLPGDPLTSPFQGMVNWSSSTSWCQVYYVELSAGDRLAIKLNADAAPGIGMGLLPPGTIDIFADFVAWSDTTLYPQLLRYEAPVAGTYYLVVWATPDAPVNTWLPYSGEFKVTAGDSQSNIPGQPLSATGTDSGAHSEMTDWNDVYSVGLSAGEALHLRMASHADGPAPGDVDLYLFDPTVTTVYGDVVRAAQSVAPPAEEDSLVYLAPSAGTYHLTTWAFGSDADYTLESTITPPTAVTCSASKTSVPYGGYVSISGGLSEGSNPLGSQYVLVQGLVGGTFKTVAHAQTTAADTWPGGPAGTGAPWDLGTYKLTLPRTVNTRFRSIYGGSFFKHSPSASGYQDLFVNAWLPTPSTPSVVYHGRAFTAYGYLKPRHTVGSYPVQLRFERLENHRWIWRKTVKAKAYNYASYTRYRASVVLPFAGSWRVYAYHPGDAITATSGNAPTKSGIRLLKAR